MSGGWDVVGCTHCEFHWLLEHEGRQRLARIQCPQCQTLHDPARVKALANAETKGAAAEERAHLLAARADDVDHYADVVSDHGPYDSQRELVEARIDRRREWVEAEADAVLDRRMNTFATGAERVLDRRSGLFEASAEAVIGPDRDAFATALEDWRPGQHHPDAELWEALATDRLDDRVDDVDHNRDRPGIQPVRPPAQTSINCLAELGAVSPTYTDWLPDLLDALLEPTAAALAEQLAEEDTTDGLAALLPPGSADDWTDEQGAGAEWLVGLQEYVRLQQREDVDADRLAELREQLTHFAIGDGAYNAGLGALYYGPIQVLRATDTTTGIRCRLDAPAWDALDDRRTGRRALTALSILGAGLRVEIVLSSPALERVLRRRFAAWTAANLDLTDSRDATPPEPGSDTDLLEFAWAALDEYSDGDAHLRILKNVPTDGCQQRTFIDDPEISVNTPGGVSRYVSDLEADGLLVVDRSGAYNHVEQTAAGERAAELIDPETYALRSPSQASLDEYLTPTLQSVTSAVSCAQQAREGGEGVPSAEGWLADTGDPTASDNDYVQWLNGPTHTLDAWPMHKRLTAAVRGPGVTLVEDRIKAFDDARVTYASCFDDELVVLAQYGKPLRTQGRLAGVLLSERVLSKVLSPDRVGDDLEGFYANARDEFEADLRDVLKWGHQIDARFFSEDDVDDYEDFREAVREVRAFCLKKLGELVGTDRFEERGALMEDLWGLITSATHMFYAAGVDVVLNVRVPRTHNWDDLDRRDFLDFVQHLVEKQTVYKHHSGHRMVIEDREEKLKQRLEYADDVDPADPTMDMTADVLLTGPAMVDLYDDVERAVASNEHRLREAVAEGEETAAVMEIPVYNGSSYAAIRELVEDLASWKGYRTATSEEIEAMYDPGRRQSVERLARLLLRAFNTADRPHRASPHDVAEALYRMKQSSRSIDWLTVRDVEAGLARMAPTRLLPELPPTMTQIIQATVASDEPLGRSAIIEQTGISESSYDRHIREAAALDVLERVDVEGRPAYTGHLEPWWAPQSGRDEPYTREELYLEDELGGDLMVGEQSQPELYGSLYFGVEEARAGVDFEETLTWPYRDMWDACPVFRRWSCLIWPSYASEDHLKKGPPDLPPEPEADVVRIGPTPPAAAPGQAGLDEDLVSSGNTWSPATDGGTESPDSVGEGSQ